MRLLHPADVQAVPGSGDSAGEKALLENGVNAPIAVDDLGNPEVDRNRHQRDCLVLGESLVFIRNARILRKASLSARSTDDFS